MSFFDKLLKGAKIAVDVMNSTSAKIAYDQVEKNTKYLGGRSLSSWENEWRYIGRLESASLTPFNKSVGLYKACLNGKIMYIGRAVEWNNGGFRKRLSDYRRESDSARKHSSGQNMYNNRGNLDIYILITGQDAEAAKIAAVLEKALIGKYNPPWNKMFRNT